MNMHRLSNIWGPIRNADPNVPNVKSLVSKSTKLFSDGGFVRILNGKATLLPPLVRSLRKLETIVHEEMEKVSAQEILLPTLIQESLLAAMKKNTAEELFKLTDRKERKYILGATHEEAITDLLRSESPLKNKILPARLYQIGTKYRDEAHPKYGLIRAKEFIMNDLYCFDIDAESRNATYGEISRQYDNFFKRLQVPYERVVGSPQEIGGTESHEYHYITEIGEDDLLFCNQCGYKTNRALVQNPAKCQSCSGTDLKQLKGIEVGHTFNIGTLYSEKLDATFTDQDGAQKFIEMSCYGLGLTRILATAVEVLSTSTDVKWPMPIAPYLVCIIPSKEGSKEAAQSEKILEELYPTLDSHLKGDIVVDDRYKLTIGKRIHLDRKLGFPYIIVIGKDAMNAVPQVEVHDVNMNHHVLVNASDAVNYLMQIVSSKMLASH